MTLCLHSFWFSFTEFAAYDNPAFIDYILNVTGQPKLNFIGHSEGGMNFFPLLSEDPTYNNKIRLAVLLAPAVYLNNSKHPLVQIGKRPEVLSLLQVWKKTNNNRSRYIIMLIIILVGIYCVQCEGNFAAESLNSC